MEQPEKERIYKMEVETIMEAYLRGYMVRQGWIQESIALQSAYMLGRNLREEIRAMGISLNFVNATLGTVMATALIEIVRLGMQPE